MRRAPSLSETGDMAAGRYFGTAGFDKTFDIGLDMLLDEMERIRDGAHAG